MTRCFDDVQFLSDPDRWPKFPICPVKRYSKKDKHGFPECGVVTATGIAVVVVISMFELPITEEEYEKLTKYRYESMEDLVTDGWLVD